MKKSLLMSAVVFMAFIAGCKKPQAEEAVPAVSLEVTGIENNCATIRAMLVEGNFYGAKLIESMVIGDVDIDYTKDIQLVNFVEEYGTAVTFPYEKTIEKVRIGQDRFTAVIVYDKSGRASAAAYEVWTPEGNPDGWSSENNPGELGEINW